MKKMIKYVSALLLVSTLSACGGGGGGSSTPTNPNPPTNPPTNPPVNVAPTLTIDSSVSLDENTEKMVTFTATDSDGAPIIEVTNSMTNISVLLNGNQINIKASEVQNDEQGTIKITAIDSKDKTLKTEKDVSVLVKNILPPNKMASIELSQFNVKIVEGTQNTINVIVRDEDNTASVNNVTVSSLNEEIAKATIFENIISINGLKLGTTRIAVMLEDKPNPILTTYIDVEVTEAGLPTLVLNRNQVLEMSEDERVEFDIEIIGSKSEEYVPTVTLVEQVGELTDLEYSVEGRKLIVKTKMLPPLGNYFNNLYTVKVSATNGTKTITTNDTNLLVFKKMNAVPIFEFSNVFGPSILVNQTGETRITMTINDDNASNITFTQPEAWFNRAVSGTYTIRIEDTVDPEKKTLIINTTGFAKDEKFGSFLGYSDGQLGGKMGLQFRTYNFTNLDQEVIDYAEVITSKVEALKEYVEIAKFYSEVLENEGVLTSLEADNYVDLITTEDVDNSRLETIEYYISMAFEMALIDDFNKDPNLVNTMKFSLDSLFSEVEQQVGKLNIDLINEMASMSKGKLPLLTYENIVNQYEGVYYSKFVGNSTYGSSDTGSWVFKPEYSFLNATKLRVQDNYKARVN